MKPPLTELDINTAETGYYEGFTKVVTITSKVIIGALIVWAVAFPEQAGAFLGSINGFILSFFNVWYIYAIALFLLTCLVLALIPSSGKLKLGLDHEEPEFDRFSWFSMMFGAGIGIGMLTFATAEPLYHWQSNPDTIRGLTEGTTAGNVRSAYEWSFLHWGFGAWGAYALAGLGLAFFSYRRGLPLTIRSSLTPLFGDGDRHHYGGRQDRSAHGAAHLLVHDRGRRGHSVAVGWRPDGAAGHGERDRHLLYGGSAAFVLVPVGRLADRAQNRIKQIARFAGEAERD